MIDRRGSDHENFANDWLRLAFGSGCKRAGRCSDCRHALWFRKICRLRRRRRAQATEGRWDFNFTDPRAVGTVFNYVNALLSATSEFGPHEIEPIKVVVVSHGAELVVFARKNYQKYKEIADRAAALAKQGVKFEICRNAASFLGFAADDFHGFVTLVPPAPYALAYWQAKGYTLNAVGATMPITPLSDLNKADTNRN